MSHHHSSLDLRFPRGDARLDLTDLLAFPKPGGRPVGPDPTRYPDNGRTLTDDVVDAFLPLLTNGKVTVDMVGAHRDLLAEFPYRGPPHRT
jgi:hypothetical protein